MKTNRMPRLSFPLLLALVLASAVLAPGTALAYIDPGTGSFIVQGIIAAVVGAGLAIKMFWSRIVSALTGKSRDEDDDDD